MECLMFNILSFSKLIYFQYITITKLCSLFKGDFISAQFYKLKNNYKIFLKN